MASDRPTSRGFASRRGLLLGASALSAVALVGCGKREETAKPEPAAAPSGPPEGSLEWAVTGPWRIADRARDEFRHPMETLRFFGLRPDMTVVEFWPGSGWYTEILAPYLAEGGGTYIAAGFATGPGSDPAQAALMAAYQRQFSEDRPLYGEIQFTAFGAMTGPVAPAGTADMALTYRASSGPSDGPPRMFIMTVHGAVAPASPSGRSSTARRCCSNWLVTAPSWLQWPLLCGRIASSLTRTPDGVSNSSTASIPTTSSDSAIRSATC